MSAQCTTPGNGRYADALPARPRELQDSLNFYVYHPLASRLARRLAPTPITPNMISIAGGLCVVATAIAYTRPGWPLPALLGLVLHMSWHVFDGADGDLARLTGRSGPIGELIDGICDYTGHIILYLALGALLEVTFGPIAWALAVAAGVSRIVQANHFEGQRRQYQWWVHGVPWLRNARYDGLADRRGLIALGAAYLALASRLAPGSPRIEAAIGMAESDQDRLKQIRSIIKRNFVKPLQSLNKLNANQRTIALGFSMLAGSPIYYFLYESVALNVILIRSISRCNAATGRIGALIGHTDPSAAR